MKIVESTLSVAELVKMAERMFGGLVKGVVDIRKNILILDAALHADEEQKLLEQGSDQNDLWGINLYPEFYGTDDFIEFDSMINVRPSMHNLSRSVESEEIKIKIRALIQKKITP
jgi:hypothetical protein